VRGLTHHSDGVGAVWVGPGRCGVELAGRAGQGGDGWVDVLAARLQHSSDRVLGEPVDLQAGMQLAQLIGDRRVTLGVARADRRGAVEESLAVRAAAFGNAFTRELDIAGITVKPEEIGYAVVAITAVLWIGIVVLARPNPVMGVLLLPMFLGFTAYATKVYIRSKVTKRVKAFQGQLETVLRSLAGGLRVGLGLRQALISVGEQSDDPAKREFARVVGATNERRS